MASRALWTFFVEYEGGTYISQFNADTLNEAIEQYNNTDPSGVGAIPLLDDPIALDGLENAWCARDDVDIEKSMLAHIVKTTPRG